MEMKLKLKRLCSTTTCHSLYKRITFLANEKKIYHWRVLETRKTIIIECQEKPVKITKKREGSQSLALSWMKVCWQIWNVSFWDLTAPLYQYLHQMLLWNIQWTEILITRSFNFNFEKKKKKITVSCVLSSFPFLTMGFSPPVSRSCSRAQKAPKKDISQKEADLFFFFNYTLKSATSNTFSLLLNRFFLFSSPEGAAHPSQWALAKFLLLPAASGGSTGPAPPTPRALTASTWTEGVRKNGCQSQLSVCLSPSSPKSFPSRPCRLLLTPKAYRPFYSPVRFELLRGNCFFLRGLAGALALLPLKLMCCLRKNQTTQRKDRCKSRSKTSVFFLEN